MTAAQGHPKGSIGNPLTEADLPFTVPTQCQWCEKTPAADPEEDPLTVALLGAHALLASCSRVAPVGRRLVGCFYCGLPCRGDVCTYCSDLPLRDPLVAKARLPLSEAERLKAAG